MPKASPTIFHNSENTMTQVQIATDKANVIAERIVDALADDTLRDALYSAVLGSVDPDDVDVELFDVNHVANAIVKSLE